jgi:hypothetical protein
MSATGVEPQARRSDIQGVRKASGNRGAGIRLDFEWHALLSGQIQIMFSTVPSAA